MFIVNNQIKFVFDSTDDRQFRKRDISESHESFLRVRPPDDPNLIRADTRDRYTLGSVRKN